MITVGLINELGFIAQAIGSSVIVMLGPISSVPVFEIVVGHNLLSVSYKDVKIWVEDISVNGFFGIESCDTISRIAACIDEKDFTWKDKYPSPIFI